MTNGRLFRRGYLTPLGALASLLMLIGYRDRIVDDNKHEVGAAIIEWGISAGVITPANDIVKILNAWTGKEWFDASDLQTLSMLIYEDAEKGKSRTLHLEVVK